VQTDWLVQQLSQFARVLAVILGLKERKKYRESLEIIEEALNTLLDLNLEKLQDLPSAELFRRLTFTETAMVGREKVMFVAALLDDAGDIHAAQGQTETGAAFYARALQLMFELTATDDNVSLPNYALAVDELLAKVDPETLPLEARIATMFYLEKTGAYAKAENTLFAMLDAVTGDPDTTADVVAVGDMFYERIRQQSDAVLIAGNLARDEITVGLSDLHHYTNPQKE
jgi:tetratricopeptide (TPR) repeat protein